VLVEKYLYTESDSRAVCAFLLPMLTVDFKHRAAARDMIGHKWLEVCDDDEVVEEW
jgi:hypothetical protein